MQKIDIEKFKNGYERDYEDAYAELKTGKKSSHWMWYIFPQVSGLGVSGTSEFYSIHSEEEARLFYNDPYIQSRFLSLCNILLESRECDIDVIFPFPDNLKLFSSLTLFAEVIPENKVFDKLLDKYYDGMRDEFTVLFLQKGGEI